MTDLVNSKRNSSGEGGFTLIELLVVIVILGILSAVVVFAVRGVGDKGASSAAAIDARAIRTAQEAFCAKNGYYATSVAALQGAQLLSAGSGSINQVQTDGITGPCGNGSSGPSGYRIICTPSGAQTCAGAVAAGAVVTGGVIRVAGGNGAAVSGTNFLNPAVTSGGGVHPNVEYMFNGLMRWAENNTSQPDLAQSYTISPDQKTYTFTLRSGMTWHNGTPITPADVKFTFEQALLKFHGRTSASIGPALGVTGTDAAATTPVGAITTTATDVVFHFVYAYAPLLKQMNVTEAPIIPENVYGQCAYAPYNADNVAPHGTINLATCPGNNPGAGNFPAQTMVGSGPFQLKSRDTTTGTLVFTKFAGYHFPGLPVANEVDQLNTTDVANALIANSIDVGAPANNRILPIVAPQTTADITPAAGYSLFQPPRGAGGGNCILTESFNLWAKGETPAVINAKAANAAYDNPFLGDPTIIPAANGHPAMTRGQLVRTALFKATDRQALFNANQFGKGAIATSPYYSKVPGYVAQSLPTYDPTTAGQWLEDAGWTDFDSAGPPGNHNLTVRQATFTSDAAFTAGVSTQRVLPGDPLAVNAISGTGSQSTYRTTIASQWAAAPVKVTLGNGGFPSGDANGNFGAHAANRDYDILTVSYCNGDDPVVGVRRQYYAATSVGATAASQIGGTAFTNSAGYRTTTMDSLWDSAAQNSSNATHASIQAEAAANVPYLWLDESLGSRAWRTAKCSGFNNYNTGLFVETAGCTG